MLHFQPDSFSTYQWTHSDFLRGQKLVGFMVDRFMPKIMIFLLPRNSFSYSSRPKSLRIYTFFWFGLQDILKSVTILGYSIWLGCADCPSKNSPKQTPPIIRLTCTVVTKYRAYSEMHHCSYTPRQIYI